MADGSTNVPGVPAALFAKHTTNKENPHSVTKSQVGLGNVDNTSDEKKPVSELQAIAIADAKKAGTEAQNNLKTHNENKQNPHGVTATQVGADPAGTAANTVSSHNTSTEAHNDIRILLSELSTKVNNFLDSDDTTLDELSELISAIKANAGTIEQITVGKVNVTDIINNLSTNLSNKPLSAAMGVELKRLIDNISIAVDSTLSVAGQAADAKAVGDKFDQLSSDIGKKLGYEAQELTEAQQAQVRENLAITPENIGALSMELLWENASPTSSFAAQVVTLPDNSQRTYVIEIVQPTKEIIGWAVLRSNESYIFSAPYGSTGYGSGGDVTIFRKIVASTDTIAFWDSAVNGENLNWVVTNDNAIPAKIYGIKGVSA